MVGCTKDAGTINIIIAYTTNNAIVPSTSRKTSLSKNANSTPGTIVARCTRIYTILEVPIPSHRAVQMY